MTLHCKFHYLALPARREATEDQLNKQEITFSLYSPWLSALTMVPRPWKLNRHLHEINNSLVSPRVTVAYSGPRLPRACWRGWGCWEQIKKGLMCQRGSQRLSRSSAADKCTCSIPGINGQGLSRRILGRITLKCVQAPVIPHFGTWIYFKKIPKPSNEPNQNPQEDLAVNSSLIKGCPNIRGKPNLWGWLNAEMNPRHLITAQAICWELSF